MSSLSAQPETIGPKSLANGQTANPERAITLPAFSRNKPRVTIIVSCYNHGRFVDEAIETLVNQTYRDYRLVVVNDGSTDDSFVRLRKLANRHGFFLVDQENRGFTRTINRALDEYTDTEYVVIFASDDLCEPDRLERQVAFLDQNPSLAMAYGDAWKIDEHGKRIGRMLSTPAQGNVFEFALTGALSVPAQTTLWRKSALDAVGRFEPGIKCEDIWLLWSVTRRFPIGHMPGIFASYREHGSQTSRNALLMVTQAQNILERFADAPGYAKARKQQELFWFFALARNHKREALRYFSGAARQPTSPLFWGGLITIFGLGGLRAPYRALRDRFRGN